MRNGRKIVAPASSPVRRLTVADFANSQDAQHADKPSLSMVGVVRADSYDFVRGS
jgi:hypothetical protein